MNFPRWVVGCLGFAAGAGGLAPLEGEAAPQLRVPPLKQAYERIEPGWSRERLSVKFHDGTDIRAVAGELRGREIAGQPGLRAVLAKLHNHWWRAHTVDDETLRQWRERGEAMSGEALPDLRLLFEVDIPRGLDALEILNALQALDCVEYAAPVPEKASLPLAPPPERIVWQDYLQASPAGIDADYLWATYGTRGAGVRVVDIEHDFNASHADLPAVSLIPGGAPYTAGGNDHGTAVLGIMAMRPNNGFGGNGIAPDAQYFFAYAVKALSPLNFDVGDAILRSMPSLSPGDIILVEQQIAGPNANETTQEGYVSIEWFKPWYDAVKTAIANGFIVVLPAGNGYRNLDDPMYATGNGGHYPFLAQNDSGAIYVGAGASSPATLGSDAVRARLPFSNYGSRVNVQGYGERVYTTGYGLESSTPADPNYHFTWDFRGTSAAAPMVAGAAALMQSAYKQKSGKPGMNSRAMRAILEGRGLPQQAGVNPVSQKIGPLPHLREAVLATYPTWQPVKLPGTVKTGPLDDYDGDGVQNLMEFALGMNPKLATRVGLPVVDFPNGVPRMFYQTDWSAGTTRYIPETSTDLVNWNSMELGGTTADNKLEYIVAGSRTGQAAWGNTIRLDTQGLTVGKKYKIQLVFREPFFNGVPTPEGRGTTKRTFNIRFGQGDVANPATTFAVEGMNIIDMIGGWENLGTTALAWTYTFEATATKFRIDLTTGTEGVPVLNAYTLEAVSADSVISGSLFTVSGPAPSNLDLTGNFVVALGLGSDATFRKVGDANFTGFSSSGTGPVTYTNGGYSVISPSVNAIGTNWNPLEFGIGLTIESMGRSGWAESFRVTASAAGPSRFLRLRVVHD
jgi:hypothetical protein